MSEASIPVPAPDKPSTSRPNDGNGASERATWVSPRLTRFGDLRQLTMGPSPGTGETGNPTIFRNA